MPEQILLPNQDPLLNGSRTENMPVDVIGYTEDGVPSAMTETDIKLLADAYATEIEAQLQARAPQEEQWERWIRAYEAEKSEIKKTYPWSGAANLTVGLVPIYVDSVVARIMSGLFSVEPHWTVTQQQKQFAPACKPMERYLDVIRQRLWDQYKVVKPVCLEMCKLGTGILYNGWKDEQTYYRRSMIEAPTPGPRITGPAPQWVPRSDFLIPSGYSTIEHAPYVAYRQYFSWNVLANLENQGYWDVDIEKLRHLTDDIDRLTLQRAASDAPLPHVKPEFGLWELWQVWFSEDLDGDGYAESYVAILHLKSRTLLRLRPNRYPCGMKPFVKCSFVEREGNFDGIGIPQMVEAYQEEASTMHNQRLDNAHIANTLMFKARKGSGVTESERIYPGKIWLLTDTNDLQEMRIGQNYLSTISEEQFTIGLAEKRIGITDSNQGRENSATGRAAATTVLALLQEGTRRFDLNTSELRRAISEQGMQVCELWQTYGLPEAGQPYSPEQILDPEEAAFVRALISVPDGVRGLINVSVNMATAAVNREVEKQSSLQLYQLVTQYIQQVMQTLPVLINPQAPPEAKGFIAKAIQGVDKLMERVFQAHQVYDLDSVLLSDMLEQMAAQPPQAPAMPQMGGMQ